MRNRHIYNVLFFAACLLVQSSTGQHKPPVRHDPPVILEEQLENMAETDEDQISEDDAFLQDLAGFLKNPVNLNYADEGLIQQLKLLTPIQVTNLLIYRKVFGNFLHIYELQAIPGWDVFSIKRILPYVTVSEKAEMISSVAARLRGGEHVLLVRASQVLEKSKGYLADKLSESSFYPGSPQKLLTRYKYKFKNSLQFGFTAEKDAGESFFRGAQKSGFDFYSAHFFARNAGVFKAVALGDFAINLGQGLIHWQSLSFNKGAEILNAKRQSDVIRPYNSAGEIAFHRGAGVTLSKRNWEVSGFASYRNLDAGFEGDNLQPEQTVSSLRLSGLHRTASEIRGRHVLGQFAAGGNVRYTVDRFTVGFNTVNYAFSHPLLKEDELYNKYAIKGDSWRNHSIDYSFTYRNVHFFGETAIDKLSNMATINGLAVSVARTTDMSFVYRSLSPRYQSLYSSAFTENSNPNNERGFYTGITVTPTSFLRINGYADFYSFPWLKYRVDAPSSGNDYMIQVTYKPSREVEIYSRYRTHRKAINYNPFSEPLHPVVFKVKQNLRTQFSYKLNQTFTIRSRVELSWFDRRGDAPEEGILVYAELHYKPLLNPLAANARLAYFETGGFESRLYAFENDVLYGYSIPVFYDKGYRYYLNVNYDIYKKLTVWIRVACIVFEDKETIGSGLDEIKGNRRSELKVQFLRKF